ncbi:MAG: hypothetical protein AB1696_04720 [Planctomycetota bacterium]
MILVESVNGVPIRLTAERWDHIAERHPEMEGERRKVLDALNKPDFVHEGDFGELLAVKFYEVTPLTSKHLVVAYKENSQKDGFIITAYFTSKPLVGRRVVWTR